MRYIFIVFFLVSYSETIFGSDEGPYFCSIHRSVSIAGDKVTDTDAKSFYCDNLFSFERTENQIAVKHEEGGCWNKDNLKFKILDHPNYKESYHGFDYFFAINNSKINDGGASTIFYKDGVFTWSFVNALGGHTRHRFAKCKKL